MKFKNSSSFFSKKTVQPVPTPNFTAAKNNKNKEGGNNQKLKLFNLGNRRLTIYFSINDGLYLHPIIFFNILLGPYV